jgi:hypothetical protein
MGSGNARRTVAAVAAVTLLIAGCGRDPSPEGDASGSTAKRSNPPVVATAASLERFDACPELLSYLRTEGGKRVGPYGLPGAGVITMDGGMAVTDKAAGAAESAAAPQAPGGERNAAQDASGTGFSGTNVQESSVDEPDVVKTDGKHIFTTRTVGNEGRMRLTAVAVNDGKPKVAGNVLLPEGAGTELLLAGDRLLAFGTSFSTLPARGGVAMDMMYPPGGGGNEQTIVGVIDVSDPTNMRVTDVVKLDGSYTSARMIGGIARLVLNTSSPSRVQFEQPTEPTVTAEQAALAKNKRVMQTATLEALLPRYEIDEPNGNKRSDGALTTCDSTFRPKTFSGFQTTSVVTIDPAKPDPRNSAAVLGAAGTVYASADNLYVATMNWPEAIPMVVDDAPVGSIAPVQPDPTKTLLHRFDIAATNAEYAASGEVRGTVLNQWSMSEHAGFLRVATTEDTFGQTKEGVPSTKSYVTTFKANGGKLDQVGQVGNLGAGERIYGVRFLGDVGYIVTFRQVDPLHVIDLTDPTKPKVLGELKIPGYSAYLHPVGDGLLLGIGQDVREPAEDGTGGQQLGTQLSLFDVSDPTSPKRVDSVRVDNSNSPIEWDHHAFTWWDPTNLAIVPVSSYGAEPQQVEPDFGTAPGVEKPMVEQLHVAIGYRIDGDKIREVGRANHAKHVDDLGFAMISRSIVIGDEIYTLSQGGIMSNDLGSFDERGWASLT